MQILAGTAFADFVAPYGFVATACGESRDTPEGRRWEFFFNTWPAEWLLQYQQNDFVRHDLLPMVARFSAQAFTWLEALSGRTPTIKQREHHEWANGLGIVDALAVPIHYPGGDLGLCVSIADHPIDDSFERDALQMVSLFTYQRCRQLGGQQRDKLCAETADAPRDRLHAMGNQGQVRQGHRRDSGNLAYDRKVPHRTGKKEARRQNPNPGCGNPGFPWLFVTLPPARAVVYEIIAAGTRESTAWMVESAG
jgi:hypothetical protein